MLTADLIFGFILTKLLSPAETKSPAVVFPPTPGPNPTPGPTPSTSTPSPQLPAPTFPTGVSVPEKPPALPAGFKRAVEVWIVNPVIARQQGAALVGAPPAVAATGNALTLQALESHFPQGWVGAKSATAEEAATAKALLAKWKDGGVMFMGPPTLTGRRAFRMTKHPATGAATVPTSSPGVPQPATVPASFPTPAATPAPSTRPPTATPSPVTTLPEVLVTADAPTGEPIQQVTAVRKGEGLAQVAKRLGRPATQQSAVELRAANLPGPNGDYTSQDLTKGGLKKRNRAGGLQPGDRLFVPKAWGPIDAARL